MIYFQDAGEEAFWDKIAVQAVGIDGIDKPDEVVKWADTLLEERRKRQIG